MPPSPAIPPDPYRLQRFVDAQEQAGTYERALAELRAGRKRLYARAAPDEPLFRRILDQYFDGIADDATDARI